MEPVHIRRRREAAARELPALVHLLATALESGADVADSLRLVCDALPGPAADLLSTVPARLALGVPPDVAWRPVLDSEQLAPLGRAMVRAHRSGAPVTDEVARLADELERRTRSRVEDRARAVGVKAALPLGLCLLPSFLLLGVVPLVAGLLRSLAW
jgi:pilus assembly protein TadC